MVTLSFADRRAAGECLAEALDAYKADRPVVLAIPRGAVPMGRLIADRLGGELDVVLVQTLGAPGNPELALGTIDENGSTRIDDASVAMSGASEIHLRREIAHQLQVIRSHRHLYSAGREPVPLAGRTVIVVDDGLAAGATLQAVLRFVRAEHPGRVVCALPVAAAESLAGIRSLADDVFVLVSPIPFESVQRCYADLSAVEEDEVVAALAGIALDHDSVAAAQHVEFRAGLIRLHGDLGLPPRPRGVVVFAHGTGSSRHSPRNVLVAQSLNRQGFATLLFDLLTPSEDASPDARFDVALLTHRLEAAITFVRSDARLLGLPTIVFGASTGAAAALRVAAHRPAEISAVISRGGRPDLAGALSLARVKAPTLLLVGAEDHGVLELNRAAKLAMRCEVQLQEIPGATHLFQEAGALQSVAERAAHWIDRVLPAAHAPA